MIIPIPKPRKRYKYKNNTKPAAAVPDIESINHLKKKKEKSFKTPLTPSKPDPTLPASLSLKSKEKKSEQKSEGKLMSHGRRTRLNYRTTAINVAARLATINHVLI